MNYFKLILNSTIIFLLSHCGIIISKLGGNWITGVICYLLFASLFILINIFPQKKFADSKRLTALIGGTNLLYAFCINLILEAVWLVYSILILYNYVPLWVFICDCIIPLIILFIVFLNGIIRVYSTSIQLGIKIRVLGILFGFIFPVNLIMLGIIISTTNREYYDETNLIERDKKRQADKICSTKYPVILVHGVFFRDFRYLNYWGRIPDELQKNGAIVFYGNQQSAISVEKTGYELVDRIKEVLALTGAEKVNIIAHSKGGLDTRYAITKLGMDKYIASLTTINTPHRGCIFVDWLLKKAPEKFKNTIAKVYNATFKKFGEKSPDFISAVECLTSEYCKAFNENVPDMPNVYYQSTGSMIKKATGGKFPLNLSHGIVKKFDGANDGLVSIDSAKWGEKFTYIETKGKRGVSHGDMIDLNRENIKGFDVREFYINIVSELKSKGF